MTNLFESVFFHQLAEELNAPADDASQMSDADAMKSTLDPGTNPDDLNVQQHTIVAAQASAAAAAKMVEEVQSWIGKLDEMIQFLNGVDSGSVQSQLASAAPKSLFDSIRVSESKKISRVSMDIASLSEMLKGYLAGAADPKYKGV
jgi:hypothetical protein